MDATDFVNGNVIQSRSGSERHFSCRTFVTHFQILRLTSSNCV